MNKYPSKRKPGAQPGNLNALKHGYNAGKTISGRPSARWVVRLPDASQKTMTTPKNGFYSHSYSSEDFAKLNALPSEQYLEHVKFALLILAVDLLKHPDLSTRERVLILTAITRLIGL